MRKTTKGRQVQQIKDCLRDEKGNPVLDKAGNKTYLSKIKTIRHTQQHVQY